MSFVVAIDGPTASGKGSLARALAARFRFAHLDTGALYRAVGLAVLEAGGDPQNPEAALAAARALDPTRLGDPALRREAVGIAASKVSAIPQVRAALLAFQRDFAAHPPGAAAGAVLDGRDIGTVVCPDAGLKLFVTADPATRAGRRCAELLARGEDVSLAEVRADLDARDARDASRAAAPMAAAEDAVLLDTTDLSIDAAVATAAGLIWERMGAGER